MAAAASFSWGVFTSDSPESIPDVNSVFQWYGFIPDDGNTLELDVLFREYTFKPSATAGPVFAESRFTIESAIRKCFDTAAKASVKKLLSSYNKKVKDLIDERMVGANKQQKEYFKNLFDKFNDNGIEKYGGMALFEPYNASKQNPAIHIEGVEFNNQGSRLSKRIRLISVDDQGPCPVTVKLNAPDSIGLDIDYETVGKINPYIDMRLLAGELQYGNPLLFKYMQQFINHLDYPVECLRYDEYEGRGESLFFPTVLLSEEMKTIIEDVVSSNNTCYAMFPFYGNMALSAIEKKIQEKINTYKDQLRIFIQYFQVLSDLAFAKIQDMQGEGVEVDSEIFSYFYDNETSTILRNLGSMEDDPVLWINSPVMNFQLHEGDVDIPYSLSDDESQRLTDVENYLQIEKYKNQVLEGFKTESLNYAYKKKFKGEKKFKPVWIPNEKNYDLDNLLTIINTVYNICFSENVAVRWSTWKKGRLEKYEEIEAEVHDQVSDGLTKTSELPYFRSVLNHAQETRYRLSILDDACLPSNITLESDDVDIDAAFKNFEYDMHVGNVAAYKDEVLSVVRLALECILIPVETVRERFEKMSSQKVLGSNPTVLRMFPELGGNLGNFKRTKNTDQDINLFETGKISAASYFVYQHILKSYTTPFDVRFGDKPNYDEVMSLLASLNPFPLKGESTIKFVKKTMSEISKQLSTKFQESYHFVQQLDNSRPSEIQQPFQPFFVNFSRTTNDKQLNWSVGSESTVMLEGMVLALNLVNFLAKKENKTKCDYNGIKDTPFKIDFKDKSFEELQRIGLSKMNPFGAVQTNKFTIGGNFVYDSKEYFEKFLGLDPQFCGMQIGRLVIGTKQKGSLGWFKMRFVLTPEKEAKIRPFMQNFEDFYQYAADMVEKSNFEKTKQPFTALCIDVDGKKKRVGFCLFKDTRNSNSSSSELINFLSDIDMVLYKSDLLVNYGFYSGEEVEFQFKPLNLYFTIQNDDGTEQECFSINTKNIDNTNEKISIKQSRTAYDINNRTHKVPLRNPIDYVPFEFEKTNQKIKYEQIVSTLMDNFKGLHYSNMKSLRRTVMAVAVKKSFDDLTKWLQQKVSVYNGNVPWAVNALDEKQRGDGMLLSMLYQSFENSSTRATDSPMADRVLIRCKGPGAADEPTPCYIENWYYRTTMFFQIEVKVMNILSDTASRFQCQMPVGTVLNPIAKIIAKCKNLHEILIKQPRAAPAICKIMINVYEFEKVGHRSKSSRDKAALKIQSETIISDAHYILFRI